MYADDADRNNEIENRLWTLTRNKIQAQKLAQRKNGKIEYFSPVKIGMNGNTKDLVKRALETKE